MEDCGCRYSSKAQIISCFVSVFILFWWMNVWAQSVGWRLLIKSKSLSLRLSSLLNYLWEWLFFLAAKCPTLFCLPDCTIFNPHQPLSFTFPLRVRRSYMCSHCSVRVTSDLSDPAEALKTSQRAAVRPTVWPDPPSSLQPLPALLSDLSKSSFTLLSRVWNSERNIMIYWPWVLF